MPEEESEFSRRFKEALDNPSKLEEFIRWCHDHGYKGFRLAEATLVDGTVVKGCPYAFEGLTENRCIFLDVDHGWHQSTEGLEWHRDDPRSLVLERHD